ncbi:MAG: SGNH/GDSL hydrolase family protein [Puniceicoccaceae bacterium]
MLIKPNDRILFQGDSITDCLRDQSDPTSLGEGYVKMTAGFLAALHPELAPVCLNRGISGHRAKDLVARWKADCLDLQPDVLSLMIGINDTWRRYDSNDPTSTEEYAGHYRSLLEQTRAANPDLRIVLMEPFVLPVPEDRKAWREDLEPRIEVVHELAGEFKATLVRLDKLMNEACQVQPPAYWAEDGVHPSLPGHALIARHWLEAVGAL